MWGDPYQRAHVILALGGVGNLVVGLFFVVRGVADLSAWEASNGLYYVLQGAIALYLAVAGFRLASRTAWEPVLRRSPKTLNIAVRSGVMMLVSTVFGWSLLIFIAIWGETKGYPQQLIFGIAAYFLAYLVQSLVNRVRYRRMRYPTLEAAKTQSLLKSMTSVYFVGSGIMDAMGISRALERQIEVWAGVVVVVASLLVSGAFLWQAIRIRRLNGDADARVHPAGEYAAGKHDIGVRGTADKDDARQRERENPVGIRAARRAGIRQRKQAPALKVERRYGRTRIVRQVPGLRADKLRDAVRRGHSDE